MPAERTGRYSAVARESQPQLPEVSADPQYVSDAEAAGRVKFSLGAFRLNLPATVVLAGLTCLGGYLASDARKPSDPTQLLQEFAAQQSVAKQERTNETLALISRLEQLETKLTVLQGSVDGLRDRVNDLHAVK